MKVMRCRTLVEPLQVNIRERLLIHHKPNLKHYFSRRSSCAENPCPSSLSIALIIIFSLPSQSLLHHQHQIFPVRHFKPQQHPISPIPLTPSPSILRYILRCKHCNRASCFRWRWRRSNVFCDKIHIWSV
jgi:hypothetical protein